MPSDSLSDYRLIQPLGEGAAGQVFLGTPKKSKPFATTGAPVAIKHYKSTFMRDPNQRERMRREFRVGSSITHPNLVRILDARLDGDEPFLVMEFVDGVTLAEWIDQFHPISGHVLIDVADQLASGLGELHAHGIFHRDLKPANVMMSSSFEARIMDFGVVQITSETPITEGDRFIGTIRYAAPETLSGQPGNARTDLYSLGTIFYSLLFGEDIFADDVAFMPLMESIQRREPRYDGSSSRDQVCQGLLDITKALLQKDPAARPESIEEVIGRLGSIRDLLRFERTPPPLHGYVATALTNLDRNARGYVTFASSLIAEVAKQHGIYVYQPRRATDPVLHKDFDPETVYALDRKKVISADLLIVLLNEPSFGVGQELEIAAGYGKPTILIRESGVNVSRMVLGCPANFLAEIEFRTPEELQRKLHQVLEANREGIMLSRERARGSHDQRRLGPTLLRARINAGYATPGDLARTLGIAERLVDALERGMYDNVGVQMLGRIAVAVGVDLVELIGASSRRAVVGTDENVRRLERLAHRSQWLAADLIGLRRDYEKERAASGSTEIISDGEWLRRKQAFEQRALSESGADGPQSSTPTLFD